MYKLKDMISMYLFDVESDPDRQICKNGSMFVIFESVCIRYQARDIYYVQLKVFFFHSL